MLWHHWLGIRKRIRPVKNDCWGANSASSQANSASYPQRDGKWVPAKVRWRSAAGEVEYYLANTLLHKLLQLNKHITSCLSANWISIYRLSSSRIVPNFTKPLPYSVKIVLYIFFITYISLYTQWTVKKRDILFLPAALRAAQACKYLIYSKADFEVFRPAGATCCTDGGEIWHVGGDREGTEAFGPLLHDKFHPHQCNDKGVGPPKLKFLLRFDQNVGIQHKMIVLPLLARWV